MIDAYAPQDLDKVMDLSIDDALAMAISKTENKTLPNAWYEKILTKLNETGKGAFTMGLATQGIKVKEIDVTGHLKQAIRLLAEKYKIQTIYCDEDKGFYAEVIDNETGKMVEETDEVRKTPMEATDDAKKIIERLEK